MGRHGNGHRSSTKKPSRTRHKNLNLAIQHKVTRLQRYCKTHPTDLQAQKDLTRLKKDNNIE